MEKYSKESLEKLLVLIDEICKDEENFWFKGEIEKKYSINDNHISKAIIKIEKYLKIDGLELIDYSGIKNELVRSQLFRDSIEMSKYRLGKINESINFDEFGRYAHMQAEELINYFYNEKFYGNLEFVQEYILKYFTIYNVNTNITSLNQISYYSKLSAFVKGYDLEKGSFKSIFEFLSNLRNELSHRNSLDVKNEDIILSEISNKKIDIKNSFIDFTNTSKEDIDLYKKGRFIYLKRKQDYDEITINLNFLKEAIITVLK